MKKFFLLNMLLLFSQHCNASYEKEIKEINALLELDPNDYESEQISSGLQKEMINFEFLKKIQNLFQNQNFNDLRIKLLMKAPNTNSNIQNKLNLILNKLLPAIIPAINDPTLNLIELAKDINSIKEQLNKEQLNVSAKDQKSFDKSFDSFIQSLPISDEAKNLVKRGEKETNQAAAEDKAAAEGVKKPEGVEIQTKIIFEHEGEADSENSMAQGNKGEEIIELISSLTTNKNKESFVNDLADKLIDIIGLTDPAIKVKLKKQLVSDLTPSTTIGNIKQKLGNVSENDRYLRRANLTILDLLNPQSKKYGEFTEGIPSYRVGNTKNKTQLYLDLEKAITTARESLTDQTIVPSQKQQSAQLDAIVSAKDQAAMLANVAREYAGRNAAYKDTADRVAAAIKSREAAQLAEEVERRSEAAHRSDAIMHEI